MKHAKRNRLLKSPPARTMPRSTSPRLGTDMPMHDAMPIRIGAIRRSQGDGVRTPAGHAKAPRTARCKK